MLKSAWMKSDCSIGLAGRSRDQATSGILEEFQWAIVASSDRAPRRGLYKCNRKVNEVLMGVTLYVLLASTK